MVAFTILATGSGRVRKGWRLVVQRGVGMPTVTEISMRRSYGSFLDYRLA